jgi:outer membrane receptor protein involved in Fe transport
MFELGGKNMSYLIRSPKLSLLIIFLFFAGTILAGTTGKIAGRVIDANTGDPLPGANIIIEETSTGAATDFEGYFSILNLKPGVYTVRVSMLGYSSYILENVRVHIDQTSRLEIKLSEKSINIDEVIVVAERKIIKADVSASITSISARDIEEQPITSVEGAVGLQAGVEAGLVIRGGSADEALFLVDGFSMRDPRNNEPITNIALSGIEEISLERGGFNAEYGQVRSGILNIVTKDGQVDNWNGTITFRASPPSPKHFGISPYDRNSMWLKPYLDPEVAFVGTQNGTWDQYTQKQYRVFDGWNEISRQLLQDDDPTNDLSPEAAQRLFEYQHRKKPVNDQYDYDIDLGFGGPVPFISKSLGNLRFYLTYKKTREMLLIPLTRDDYLENNFTLKFTSNLSQNLKLSLSTIIGNSDNIANNSATPNFVRTPSQIITQLRANVFARASYIFSDAYWSLSDINHLGLSSKLTHVLSANTFYDLSIDYFQREYNTRPTYTRNSDAQFELFPGYFVNTAPFGWSSDIGIGIGDGITFSQSTARDNTKTSSLAVKVDLTSQVNNNNQVKSGFEFVYNNLDLEFGSYNPNFPLTNTYVNEVYNPIRAAFYLQDKIEFEGWIANIGFRLDYSNSQTDWVNIDPFSRSYFGAGFSENVEFESKPAEGQLTFSPRIGISHPITENSKLFFNYGHFKQLPSYDQLFQLSRGSLNQVTTFGDPNLSVAKTVSYEIGYDHVIFDNYLIQLAGFYHDITDQLAESRYESADASVVYTAANSNSYEDIRGLELTLKKSGGYWWRGFITYSYQVKSSGRFGTDIIYQDPTEQRKFNNNTGNFAQSKPIPQPWANLVLTFFTPNDFGPDILGLKLLSNWNLTLLGDWRAGWMATRNPNKVSGVSQNVQVKDWQNLNLRFTKEFDYDDFAFKFILDVNNVFNAKRLSLAGFMNAQDSEDYWNSLHLPKSNAYDNIVGDDNYGEYRKAGVEFQPIEQVAEVSSIANPNTRAFYYEKSSGNYLQFNGETWSEVSKSKLDKVLDDKAYIDMPNESSFNFLSPRNIYFGVNVRFKL